MESGKNYVHGTAAKKLEYDIYEENKVLREKKKQRSNSKVKFKIVLNILVLFALGFGVMFRYAVITELNYNIDKTSKMFNEVVNENSRLKVEIEKNMDLAKVKEIAENNLGMQKPDKYQVVYVDVPKNDFSVVSDKYNGADDINGILNSIYNKIVNITHLLY